MPETAERIASAVERLRMRLIAHGSIDPKGVWPIILREAFEDFACVEWECPKCGRYSTSDSCSGEMDDNHGEATHLTTYRVRP